MLTVRVAGFLIINPRAGDERPSADELRDEAERLGVKTHVLQEGEDVAEVAKSAPEGPLGMAGGDGSLAAVAEVALERGLPVVVIPFGTRNHLARDLGLGDGLVLEPLHRDRALALAIGHVREVSHTSAGTCAR